MKAYLDSNDLREAVEDDYKIPPLPNNQLLLRGGIINKRSWKSKAKSILFTTGSIIIFNKNNDNENNKRDLLFFEERAWSKWGDQGKTSIKFDSRIWDAKNEIIGSH